MKPPPFISGQEETDEYIQYVGNFVAQNELDQLDCLLIIVGFDDSEEVSTILQRWWELGLRTTDLQRGPAFKERNPVIECRYPLDVDQYEIVKDARILSRQGATDLSAVGISITTALDLREVFGKGRCPLIAVKE
jgi:hypothetical protein